MNITHGTEHRRNLTPPSPPLKLRGGRGALSHFSMEGLLSNKGVSLIELMITLAIFSIIIGMIYSVYSTLLKQATAERKVAKTELDVFTVSWPLIKEIQTSGFGVPSTTGSSVCGNPISALGNELTIHSTAAGDDSDAGKWGYIVSDTCRVISTTNWSTSSRIVVMNNLNKSRMGFTTITAAGSSDSYLTDCGTNYKNNLVYWTPHTGGASDLECYETKYTLETTIDTAPAMCAPQTKSLKRSVSHTTTTDYQPMLDCVLDLAYRFGCIHKTNGNLIWRSDTNCAANAAILKLVKVGMIIQSSPRRDSQVPADTDMSLFGDLVDSNGVSLKKPVTLTEEQRYYKWRKLEYTITLRNQG